MLFKQLGIQFSFELLELLQHSSTSGLQIVKSGLCLTNWKFKGFNLTAFPIVRGVKKYQRIYRH